MRFRRLAAAAFVAAASAASAAGPEVTATQCAADFDAMWKAVDQGYAYFSTSSRIAWRRARDAWRPKAAAASSRAPCGTALSLALESLRDDAVTLTGDGFVAPRRVPAEADIFARLEDDRAIVMGVRAGGVADVAGVHPGLVVHSIQGVAIARAVREKLGRTIASAEEKSWALNHLLAGPRAGSFTLGTRGPGAARTMEVIRSDEPNGNGPPLVTRKVGEGRDLGYLRPKNSLGDAGFVMHFDAALQHLKDTRGLILDLRETQGSGSEEVARAILGRFIETETPWQVRVPRGAKAITDNVAPRGPFAYRAPIVVLVDRWTAGEGEALATGLAAAARATLIGTQMAGMHGKPRNATLPHSGFVVHFPADKTFLVGGTTPREHAMPGVPVDILAPSGGPGDPILYQALKHFEARIPR
ncbi:S41 family peptidase [Usitatibacter palustris]|uniref:Tail specific protease domain-containing protein n=1 Tax=Usitatibacter palustris TaxID=2732487 RepID=A0A6M4H2L0_9PROT|nr:S41 family peptidase [Usitatibacter palustris]QJR13746.1 hypothetical protein DSM104440_00536 [Usitatibacter palustris]